MFAFDLDIMTDMKLLAFEVANQNNFTLLLWSDPHVTSQSLYFRKTNYYSQVCLSLAKLFSLHLGKLSSTLTF